MTDSVPTPSALLIATRERTAEALASGNLTRVNTSKETHIHGDIPYFYHILQGSDDKVKNLATQKKKTKLDGQQPNPFCPYDPNMEVAPLCDDHVLLLNKFPVIENHLLIITRLYEHQDRLLTVANFFALGVVLREIDGLGFYNGGAAAGASQHHKHLQVAPFPLAGIGNPLPLAPLLMLGDMRGRMGVSADLPFCHLLGELPRHWYQQPEAASMELHALYLAMLRRLGCGGGMGNPGPYNLLVTRDWMFLVPRSCEFYRGISINSLGFAGSIFLRNREQLSLVQQMGPLNLLRGVCFSR